MAQKDPVYSRPRWPREDFADDSGAPIDYGNRWKDGPPEWAFRMKTNTQRFAPLHNVALALVDHLTGTYRVCVTAEAPQVEANGGPASSSNRLLRLVPDAGRGTVITVELTDFPGVEVHVESGSPEAFPACGCDACDDSAEDVAEMLESHLLDLGQVSPGWVPRR